MKLKLLIFLLPVFAFAQSNNEVNWIDFEKLDSAIHNNEKPTLIFFYADWCVYCKKMEQVAFKKPQIVHILNENFNAVKMDTETTDTIVFDGHRFINKQAGTKRNSIHELAALFTKRKDHPFSLPVTVLLNADFRVIARSFDYLSPKKMMKFLNLIHQKS